MDLSKTSDRSTSWMVYPPMSYRDLNKEDLEIMITELQYGSCDGSCRWNEHCQEGQVGWGLNQGHWVACCDLCGEEHQGDQPEAFIQFEDIENNFVLPIRLKAPGWFLRVGRNGSGRTEVLVPGSNHPSRYEVSEHLRPDEVPALLAKL
jgi:hypothetical protein